MAATLGREPAVIKLAHDLGLGIKGDCLASIRAFALDQVDRLYDNPPIPISTLDGLRAVLANRYRVKLVFVERDEDVARIAEENQAFHSLLLDCLEGDFRRQDTEGITLERERVEQGRTRFLAVIDAREARAARAYFTAWHELSHLLVHPAHASFVKVRRSPSRQRIEKDPVESVVDDIAGRLAFYPRLFEPILRGHVDAHGFTFTALEAARNAAAPTASLFATARGSLAHASTPTILVQVDLALKAGEARELHSQQQSFDFAARVAEPRLRLITASNGGRESEPSLAIRRSMRVPDRSVLARCFESAGDINLLASEDQSWWEVSGRGALPPCPLRVEAIRRGRFVYGLISTMNPSPTGV